MTFVLQSDVTILVLPKEVAIFILVLLVHGRLAGDGILHNDLVGGGALGDPGDAQLSGVVLPPSPHGAVRAEGQGKVIAGGNVNDLIQDLDLAALHIGHLHGGGAILGIPDAQLAIIVLAPSPHGTVGLQAHIEVGA